VDRWKKSILTTETKNNAQTVYKIRKETTKEINDISILNAVAESMRVKFKALIVTIAA
jgi:hypothetical protein